MSSISEASSLKKPLWRYELEEMEAHGAPSDHILIVKIEGEEKPVAVYHVHQRDLSVGLRSCDYFASLFQSGFREGGEQTTTLELNETAAKVFAEFLDFIYGEDIEIDKDSLIGLASLADYFQNACLAEYVAKNASVSWSTTPEEVFRMYQQLKDMSEYDRYKGFLVELFRDILVKHPVYDSFVSRTWDRDFVLSMLSELPPLSPTDNHSRTECEYETAVERLYTNVSVLLTTFGRDDDEKMEIWNDLMSKLRLRQSKTCLDMIATAFFMMRTESELTENGLGHEMTEHLDHWLKVVEYSEVRSSNAYGNKAMWHTHMEVILERTLPPEATKRIALWMAKKW